MARIYASRTLLDPSLLSMAQSAMESNIRRGVDRRKNVLDAASGMFGSLGSELDKYIDKKEEDKKREQRYSNVAWQSSQEQMADPLYRAALEEYARTGSTAPLSNYQLAKETALERKESAQRAADKATQDAADERDRKRTAMYPEYLKAIKNALDADAAGKKGDAKIYSEQASALQKEYGYTNAGLTEMLEANEKEREAAAEAQYFVDEKAKFDKMMADRKAAESRDWRNYIDLNFMPIVVKDKAEQQYLDSIISGARRHLTDADYDYLMGKVFAPTKESKIVEAKTGAVATDAGKQTAEQLEEMRKKKQLADNARRKKAQGKGKLITTEEKKALEEGY